MFKPILVTYVICILNNVIVCGEERLHEDFSSSESVPNFQKINEESALSSELPLCEELGNKGRGLPIFSDCMRNASGHALFTDTINETQRRIFMRQISSYNQCDNTRVRSRTNYQMINESEDSLEKIKKLPNASHEASIYEEEIGALRVKKEVYGILEMGENGPEESSEEKQDYCVDTVVKKEEGDKQQIANETESRVKLMKKLKIVSPKKEPSVSSTEQESYRGTKFWGKTTILIRPSEEQDHYLTENTVKEAEGDEHQAANEVQSPAGDVKKLKTVLSKEEISAVSEGQESQMISGGKATFEELQGKKQNCLAENKEENKDTIELSKKRVKKVLCPMNMTSMNPIDMATMDMDSMNMDPMDMAAMDMVGKENRDVMKLPKKGGKTVLPSMNMASRDMVAMDMVGKENRDLMNPSPGETVFPPSAAIKANGRPLATKNKEKCQSESIRKQKTTHPGKEISVPKSIDELRRLLKIKEETHLKNIKKIPEGKK